MSGSTAARNQFLLALALGAAGAGLVLLAVRQGWARADYATPAPLPAQRVTVTGEALVPAAEALAVAGLACLAAVIATRGLARRGAGVVLAGLGAGAVAAVSGPVRASSVLAAASSQLASPAATGGSTTSGRPAGNHGVVIGGSTAHAVLTGLPWQVAVVVGGLAIVAAGLFTIWRGPRWPVMSGRFDRQAPAGRSAGPGARGGSVTPLPDRPAPGRVPVDPAALWDSLSRGVDPTDGDTSHPRSGGRRSHAGSPHADGSGGQGRVTGADDAAPAPTTPRRPR